MAALKASAGTAMRHMLRQAAPLPAAPISIVLRPPPKPCCQRLPETHRASVRTHVVLPVNGGLRGSNERVDEEIGEVLYSAEQLQEVMCELGRQVGHDYQGKDLLVLGVLKGGFVFTADLVRQIQPVPNSLEVDFFKASSYGSGTESSGKVKLDGGFDLSSVKNKHVLVAEDIIDSGLTMSSIVSLLRAAGAMSVRVAVLLDKRSRRVVTFDADYVGIVCPDAFVVGFGIDFAERYRWLPYIGVPKPEVVEAILEKKKKEAGAKQAAQDQHGQHRTANDARVSSDAMGALHSSQSSNGHKNGTARSQSGAASSGSKQVLAAQQR